ncbi:L-rhamnose mutarotase [Thermogutta sp.]|uniref:L-rhamnose mutarotase n=1 Tax=Thermogutta sp. TaxID=1962930 RepID=UPI00321F6FE2
MLKQRAIRIGAGFVLVAVGFVLGLAAHSQWENLQASEGNKEVAAKKVMRVGQVIGLRPEKKDYYIQLHANTWPGVLKRIHDSNIRNYSIYLAELDGKLYLFSYYEYIGDDYEADMAKIAADPETQRWWKETDPCQIRLPGTPEGKWWKPIPEVFHTD